MAQESKIMDYYKPLNMNYEYLIKKTNQRSQNMAFFTKIKKIESELYI